ncbi:OmpA family protein [Flavobacterium sp.]|uniref:OmpA family protein n=2 Tax=Flavobacterium sp. TaxID=239 RepID=UPI002614EAB7|nr:OmpA family protein [Flavobacterium sp.]
MKKILYTALVFIITMSGYSQKLKEAKADKQYDKFAYVDAIKTYERLFEKGYKSQEMLQKLGNAYYFNAELEKANKWYTELFALTQDVDSEYYYRYAQTLKSVKDYKKADEMLAKFNQKNGNDLRAKLAASQKDYLARIKKNSGRYTLENAGINSDKSDYGSAFFNNKVVFASARDTGGLGARKHAWTNESFTNLYAADMGSEGTLSSEERFGKKLNSKFHESTPVFTKDGKTVYFTRNNFLDGKKGKDAQKTTLLKLYKATLEGDTWTDVKELPFNSNDYSVAHPALSPDEKTLYFASNMPGTLGQSDLFKVSINGDDSYGTPTNLGNVINTEGRETFPFVSNEDELYFATDGHPGLGGLDIFVAKAEKDGSYKEALNVGEPLNSSKDDFGFLIDNKTRIGYVTSNRDGGQGSDDIYRFKETERIEYTCEQLLTGVVTDQETGKPLANAKVTLEDQNHTKIKDAITDAEGKFDFGVQPCETKLYLITEKPEYNTKETATITANETGKTFVPIELELGKKPVKPGDDLAKAFGIKIIYFDLDKSFIRPDAALELAKILDVMEQNPTMEIDVRSHTDCRQTAAYNAALSDRRAKSTMAWLISKGIAKNRLTGKGYGESQLVNDCGCEPTNQSNCSEEQHQANRRSEFIITKL